VRPDARDTSGQTIGWNDGHGSVSGVRRTARDAA
jgi:hypothetical protein